MPVNFLDNFSSEQRDMIVSLPYRVGLKVSQSDGDDAGEDAAAEQAAELQALSNLLIAYSQEIFGAETVQYVVGETVQRKAEWPKWANRMKTLEDDCNRAVDLISGVVDVKEVSAFKNCMLEIAESVALAFREYSDDMPFFQKLKLYMAYKKGKSRAEKMKKPYKTYDEFLNISLKERKALEKIAHALGVVYV